MKRLLKKPLRIPMRVRVLLKTLIHIGLLGYAGWIFSLALSGNITGDPVVLLLHESGMLALQTLLISLLLSPAAKWLPCGDLIQFRRLIGLYSGAFASSHLLVYLNFEVQWNMAEVLDSVSTRPYIFVGMFAWLGLFALSVTSPMVIRKKMGAQWQKLHRWVYAVCILGVLHFAWSTKVFWGEPMVYAAIAIALLSTRLETFKRVFRKAPTKKVI